MKCLSFSTPSNTDLLLASGSQDGYIRLWLIATSTTPAQDTSAAAAPVDELIDAFEKSLGEMNDDAEEGGKKISNRAHVFAVNDAQSGSKYVFKFAIYHSALFLT